MVYKKACGKLSLPTDAKAALAESSRELGWPSRTDQTFSRYTYTGFDSSVGENGCWKDCHMRSTRAVGT
jgi:hypothetical protein